MIETTQTDTQKLILKRKKRINDPGDNTISNHNPETPGQKKFLVKQKMKTIRENKNQTYNSLMSIK